MNKMRNALEAFRQDQSGIGVVEIILILVILIGLVLIFKNQITGIINNAFESISVNSDAIVK
ncbi:MAG: Flp1 family type IVb pilin [Lachnospiraceae bacterium]|nr:Flp1 family type IVb pilin [Lachnospiraceae bacterium]